MEFLLYLEYCVSDCEFEKAMSLMSGHGLVQSWASTDIMEGLTALVMEKEKEKEKEREKDREREKEKEKEKEKEGEMEAALYTNCSLLGLDASVLGPGPGTRAGLFRYSNPRVGEFLLYFLLSALRGPQLSSRVRSISFLFRFSSSQVDWQQSCMHCT